MRVEITERGRKRANTPGHSSLGGAVLDLLNQYSSADTRDLASDLRASEGTVRNAVVRLGKAGYIRRVD